MDTCLMRHCSPVSLTLQFSANISWVLLLSPVHTAPMALTPRPLTYLTWGESWLKLDPQNWGRWVSLISPLSVESFMYQWPLLGICCCIEVLLKRPAAKLWCTPMLSLRTVAVQLGPKVCFSGASLDLPTLVGYLELLVWTVLTCYHWQTWRTWSVHSELLTPPPPQLRFQQAVVTDTRHSVCGWSAGPYKTVQFSRLIWSSLIRVSLMYLQKECLWLDSMMLALNI